MKITLRLLHGRHEEAIILASMHPGVRHPLHDCLVALQIRAAGSTGLATATALDNVLRFEGATGGELQAFQELARRAREPPPREEIAMSHPPLSIEALVSRVVHHGDVVLPREHKIPCTALDPCNHPAVPPVVVVDVEGVIEALDVVAGLCTLRPHVLAIAERGEVCHVHHVARRLLVPLQSDSRTDTSVVVFGEVRGALAVEVHDAPHLVGIRFLTAYRARVVGVDIVVDTCAGHHHRLLGHAIQAAVSGVSTKLVQLLDNTLKFSGKFGHFVSSLRVVLQPVLQHTPLVL